MELLQHIAHGVSAVFTWEHIGWLLAGSLLGLLMGVLSGLGPLVAMALLLPMTSKIEPLSAILLLVGIYSGSQSAAMNLRILVPESGSAVPAVMATDGYQLARQGHGGVALLSASLASWVGACGAFFILVLLAPGVAYLAQLCGVAERFSLMVLSLVGAVVLSPGSVSKSLAMIVLGLMLSRVGAGELVGWLGQAIGAGSFPRDIPFEVLLMSMFVFSEVIAYLGLQAAPRQVASAALGKFKLSREQIEQIKPSIWRSSALGALVGLLPGRAAVLASLAAYRLERQMASPGGLFGRGDLRGVAGPDAACQAGVQTSFLPMLTFGIPLNAVMALFVGAMVIKGVPPGPAVYASQPTFFWAWVSALCLAPFIMLALNLPLRALWTRLLTLPCSTFFPGLVMLACLGILTLGGGANLLYLAAGLALAGYGFHKLGCPVGPLLLGFVLGPFMESHLREALQTYGGWGVLLSQPLSAAFLLMAATLLVLVMMPAIQRPRAALFKEREG